MCARRPILLLLLTASPATAAAQVTLLTGANEASRTGEENVNVWTTGVQLTITASDRAAFSIVANFILGDKDGNPQTEVTGSHVLTTVRITPFRRFWYVGTGMAVLQERYRFVTNTVIGGHRFVVDEFADEDLAIVWFTGVGWPMGRWRPFGEIRIIDQSKAPGQRVFAVGLDVRIF